MNSPHTIVIRRATAVDAETLAQLAILDSRRPLTGPALIAEADGIPPGRAGPRRRQRRRFRAPIAGWSGCRRSVAGLRTSVAR